MWIEWEWTELLDGIEVDDVEMYYLFGLKIRVHDRMMF
jgi:hypothetical protein